MPRGDGTGPTGQGPRTGRGMPVRQGFNGGGGSGGGIGQGGGGRGMPARQGFNGGGGGNLPGSGPAGNCVCPKCGEKVSHQRSIACYSISCPKCGSKMAKE
ncbi:DUF5320 domain-containing protein [bacterium]|nr:DUF5320 domain-containing protein [bacterium]